MSDIAQNKAPAKRFKVGMVLYPRLTFLDLVGPQTALSLFGDTLLLWKSLDPVITEAGNTVNPTTTFAYCPMTSTSCSFLAVTAPMTL